MRRNILAIFIITGIMLSGWAVPASGQTPAVKVFVDGIPVIFDVNPVIQQGRTLVPFRAISEALNINVTWDNSSRTVRASDQNVDIVLKIGDKTAYVNGIPTGLEVPSVIINGRTLVPLRFLTENLGSKVIWDPLNYHVKITSPPREMTITGFYALGDSKTSSWKSLFGVDYPETGSGNTDIISNIALGWYSLDAQGNLLTNSGTGWQRPGGWEKVLEAADTYKLQTEMVIHLPDQDPTFQNLSANEEALKNAVRLIVEEAKIYKGVNLDIEGLGWKEKDGALVKVQEDFSRFVRLLADELRTLDLTLTLTLHPPNSAYKGYDYKALGAAADRIIIMAYDYGAKPEPVNSVLQAVELATADVPPQKLVLGISIPNETPESLLTKIGIAKRYNLNGIALWRLGLVSQEMWDSLRNSVVAVK